MKFKRMMLVTMLLLAILTIGAASAAEDVDALAVDDAGGEQDIEAPVDDDVVQSDDALPDEKYISFAYENIIDNRADLVFDVYSVSADDEGRVCAFANESLVYDEPLKSDFVYVSARELNGTFNGVYNIKVIYTQENGTSWFNEKKMTFINIVGDSDLVINSSDFNAKFLNSEIDLNDENSYYTPVFSFFYPESVPKERLKVRWGDGPDDESMINLIWFDVNAYNNVTFGYFDISEEGTYNVTVTYEYGERYSVELARGVLNVSVTYLPDQFISQWKDEVSDIYDTIWYVSESPSLRGVVTIFDENGTAVYNKTFSGERYYEMIAPDDLTGVFYGNQTFEVVYKRAANGKEYSKNATVNFLVKIANIAPIPEDFNVKIADNEIDVDGDETAISFDWPEYTGQYDVIKVRVNDGFGNTFQKKSAGETSRNITLGELYIDCKGTYNITVYYGWDELEIAKGTIKATQAPRNYTGDDFIEIFGVYPVDEDDWFCTLRDYVEGYDVGLNGESFIYINGKLAYYNKFSGNGTIAKSVWAEKDIAGTFNGTYPVKYVYKRATDGKEYTKELNVRFFNLVGHGTVPDIAQPQSQGAVPQTAVQSSPANVIKLTLKAVTVKKSAKKLTLQATLKVNGKAVKGKKITFKFSGKKYTAKTNAKGVAKVTVKKAVLKKLKVGKKITYQAAYGKTTVKKSVKVKK